MNNKTLLYVGIAAAAYYLYNKSKKTVKTVLTTQQIIALTPSELNTLIGDLMKNPSNYADSVAYINIATAEVKRRISTSSGGPLTTGGSGVLTF
jgi:hypothetical protein